MRACVRVSTRVGQQAGASVRTWSAWSVEVLWRVCDGWGRFRMSKLKQCTHPVHLTTWVAFHMVFHMVLHMDVLLDAAANDRWHGRRNVGRFGLRAESPAKCTPAYPRDGLRPQSPAQYARLSSPDVPRNSATIAVQHRCHDPITARVRGPNARAMQGLRSQADAATPNAMCTHVPSSCGIDCDVGVRPQSCRADPRRDVHMCDPSCIRRLQACVSTCAHLKKLTPSVTCDLQRVDGCQAHYSIRWHR